jgi:hypothetical protein
MLGGIHFFTGASLASTLSSNPTSSFLIGFLSHHLLDYLPHFDTNLFKEKGENIKTWPKEAWFLVIFEFFDFLVLYLLFFYNHKNLWLNSFFGGLGGIFPDIISIFFRSFYQTENKIVKNYLYLHTKKFHFRKPIEKNLILATIMYFLVFIFDITLIFGLFWTPK